MKHCNKSKITNMEIVLTCEIGFISAKFKTFK